MVEYHFTTPISEEDARKLKVGDVVYVSGEHVYTARDEAHERALHMFEKGEKPPVDFEGSVQSGRCLARVSRIEEPIC